MFPSALKADGRKVGKLTRTDVIEALREYDARYGEVTTACFNSATARNRGRADLVERYYAGREDGRPWPSLNAMKKLFNGSFSDAMDAAGLEMKGPGPGPGGREPIRDVRVQRVLIESNRDRELRERIERLEARLDRARARAERVERLYAERPVRERVRERPPTTKTKTVTRVDRRPIDRLERKLARAESATADAQARARAIGDQNEALGRDMAKLERKVERMEAALATASTSEYEARSDVKRAEAEARSLSDRLTAAEARSVSLRADLKKARAATPEVRERVVDEDLIAEAEARADRAELRAARAERQMAEQGAAVTGELRKLSPAEVAELKTKGPRGPAVMGEALQAFARARKSGTKTDLDVALAGLMRAAQGWRDVL